jgi:hypothetical protein
MRGAKRSAQKKDRSGPENAVRLCTAIRRRSRLGAVAIACALILANRATAQSRGVYPLGMSATNSGVTAAPGFTYSNQLLFYSRDEAKNDSGATLPITGKNYVLMDMNTLIWASRKKFLGGARYSAFATLPFAKNDLTSDVQGRISGGAGFADSYYVPLVLGWSKERAAFRVLYGFLAPTGRFAAEANDNVGSGYWTHALSSGQTFYFTTDKSWAFSSYEMYEFHTTQAGTRTHPGETFDLDYSVTKNFTRNNRPSLQIGVVGYEQRQTTARTGPSITPEQSKERYAINALGFASSLAFPKWGLGLKFFNEFADRSTFQGYSLQFSGSVSF